MIKPIKDFTGYSNGLRVVKPRPGKNLYMRVYMRNDITHKRVDRYVHRLVAEHFLEKPEGMNTVNHKDCNRQNNNVENLEWVNSALNNAYSMKVGHLLRDPKTGRFTNPTQLYGIVHSPNKYRETEGSKDLGENLWNEGRTEDIKNRVLHLDNVIDAGIQ